MHSAKAMFSTFEVPATTGRRASVRKPDGFTLVELVVTLVIIGALAAASAPLFFSKQSFEQSGFFDETLSAVRYAQKLAVTSGCTVRVNITASGYSLLRAASVATCNSGPYTTDVVDPSDPGRPFARTAPAGVTLTIVSIDFDPLGRASVTSPSQDVSVGGRTFRVWAETGFVERL